MSSGGMNSDAAAIPDYPQVLGHPRPLWMLFMSEFWERFAFYGMRWALTLYIVAQFHNGDPSGEAPAARIYGAYLALVYATAIFGGYVADRVIGYQRSILLGAVVMAAGLFMITVPNEQILQARPGHHHHGKRAVQAEHLDHGGQALRGEGRAPRLRLHHLLHGHQRRRVHRADSDRVARRNHLR